MRNDPVHDSYARVALCSSVVRLISVHITSHFSADRTNGHNTIKFGYLTDVLNHQQYKRPILKDKGRSCICG